MIDKSLGDLKVRKSYQRVVQIDPDNRDVLLDGTGSLYEIEGSKIKGTVKYSETASYALNAMDAKLQDGDYGDIIVSDNGDTWEIQDKVLNVDKLQNIGPKKILGNNFLNTSYIREISLGSNLKLDDTTPILDVDKSALLDGDRGDINVSNDGSTWSIKERIVDFDKIKSVNKNKILGRNSFTDGTIQELTLGSNITMDGTTINVSSGTSTVGDGNYVDIEISGSGTIYKITSGSVTYSKIQDVTGSRILGRHSAFNGSAQEIQIGENLTLDGDILKADMYELLTSVSNNPDSDILIDSLDNIWTIKDKRVTTQKIQNIPNSRLLGNPLTTPGSGEVQYISLSSNLRFNSTVLDVKKETLLDGNKVDLTISNSGSNYIINPNSVIFDKMQDISGSRVLGRGEYSGTGAIEELTIGEGLTISGSVLKSTVVAGTLSDGDYGDIVVSGGGTTMSLDTIFNISQLAPISMSRVLGRNSNDNGSPEEILMGSGSGISNYKLYSYPIPGIKGDVTVTNTPVTNDYIDYSISLNDGSVTNDKLFGEINANKIGNGNISNAEFYTLEDIDTDQTIQKQLDSKFSNTLADGRIYVGNSSNTASAVSVTGDVTISNTGVTSITSDVIVNSDISSSANISFSKLENVTGRHILGRHSTIDGKIQQIEIGTGLILNGDILEATGLSIPNGDKGDISVSNFGSTWTIDNNAITTDKILDGAVTEAKLKNYISATKIGSGIITTQEFNTLDTIDTTQTIQNQLNARLGTSLTNSRIYVGNSSNTASAVSVTGDVLISNTGVTSIANNVILDADINTSANINGSKFLNSSVTFNKIQNVSTNVLLGRSSSLSGVVEQINLGTGLEYNSGFLNCTVNPISDGSSPIREYTLNQLNSETWTKTSFSSSFSVLLSTNNTTTRTFILSNSGFSNNDKVKIYVSQKSPGLVNISVGGFSVGGPTRGAGIECVYSGSQWITSLLGTVHYTKDGNYQLYTNTVYGFGASSYQNTSNNTSEHTNAFGFNATNLNEGSTAIGYESLTSGSNSIALGNNTITSGSNSIALGNNSITIRDSSIRRKLETTAGKNFNKEELFWYAFGGTTPATQSIFLAGIQDKHLTIPPSSFMVVKFDALLSNDDASQVARAEYTYTFRRSTNNNVEQIGPKIGSITHGNSTSSLAINLIGSSSNIIKMEINGSDKQNRQILIYGEILEMNM
jgi:hypothetical protein